MVNRSSLQDACSGPEFAVGEMYAIRQFRTRSGGPCRLSAVMHDTDWLPGTNVATCSAKPTRISKDVYDALSLLEDEKRESLGLKISKTRVSIDAPLDYNYTIKYDASVNGYATYLSYAETSPGESYWLSHDDSVAPKPDCTCGFYAYHNTDALLDNAYDAEWVGIIRAHGRIVVGEKGLRAEKAEVVALVHKKLKNAAVGGSLFVLSNPKNGQVNYYYPVQGVIYPTASTPTADDTALAGADLGLSSASIAASGNQIAHELQEIQVAYELQEKEREMLRLSLEKESLAREYPDAIIFESLEEMLEQFPLTGPDDFRGSTQNS